MKKDTPNQPFGETYRCTVFFMRHVKNISVTDVSLVNMHTDPRPAFAAIDIDHLIMTQVRVESSSSLPGLLVKGGRSWKWKR